MEHLNRHRLEKFVAGRAGVFDLAYSEPGGTVIPLEWSGTHCIDMHRNKFYDTGRGNLARRLLLYMT